MYLNSIKYKYTMYSNSINYNFTMYFNSIKYHCTMYLNLIKYYHIMYLNSIIYNYSMQFNSKCNMIMIYSVQFCLAKITMKQNSRKQKCPLKIQARNVAQVRRLNSLMFF